MPDKKIPGTEPLSCYSCGGTPEPQDIKKGEHIGSYWICNYCTSLNRYFFDSVGLDTSNHEPRCACILLVDNSGSMSGKPIDELNNGLMLFQQSLKGDSLASMRVEIAIISFGKEVTVEQDFITVNQLQVKPLTASGPTPMGEAINLAMNMLRKRKHTYKQNGVPYYRPWMFLITDGAPTDSWQEGAKRVKEEEAGKSVAFFAVGVQGCDINILKQISVRDPLLLKGLNFRDMFVWLSGSLTSVSQSKIGEQIPLKSPAGWAEI